MPNNSIGQDNAEQYFSTFLSNKMYQELVPGLRRLSACFHIHLTDWQTTRWRLTLTSGRLIAIDLGDGESECGFTLCANVFAEIAAGRLPPQQAFFNRQVTINGNLVLGLRLATVLAGFFRQYPYEMITNRRE